jgi:integrase
VRKGALANWQEKGFPNEFFVMLFRGRSAARGAPSPRAFSAEWADVAALMGMPDITFHALRHTLALQFVDVGVDVATISKRLGHSSPAITLVYAHLLRQRDGKAVKAINAALANLGPIG